MKQFLEHIAEDILRKHGSDLSDITIVFPNKRASLFLNEILASKCDKPIWSPRYITIIGAFEELVGDVARAMLGAQGVANLGECVAVHFKATALAFFRDVGPHRVMHEALFLNEVIDDGAFSRT